MKKFGSYFLIFILSVVVLLFGFNYKSSKQPHLLYNVYLDDEFIGAINSKSELEDYINKQASDIRENVKLNSRQLEAIDTLENLSNEISNEYSTKKELAEYFLEKSEALKISSNDQENLKYYLDEKLYRNSSYEIQEMRDYVSSNEIYKYAPEVYIPNGIKIKKIYTYDNTTLPVPTVYKKIITKKSPTIAGYKFVIKSTKEGQEDIELYTIDKDIFSHAIENLITIFVDENQYEKYKKGTQSEVTSIGSIIENIYVNQEITYKSVNVPVSKHIYTDSTSLAAYLLYGDKFEEKTVKVNAGDSIESIAFDNQISVQEFLIFNTQYTSRDNLLVAGTDVNISKVDPKIEIVVESYEVVDKETNFAVVEQYDQNLTQGSMIVTQEGEKGLERVSQNVKSVNGEIAYVDPVGKETIKSSVSKIINIGTKFVPNIGSTSSWGWPTNSGYTLSSYYGYRLSGYDSANGNLHAGIDIAGTGYGSPVKAANNGVIEVMQFKYDYGNHIMINHNNGYYTVYAHMSGFAPGISVGSTVSRGQIIGYVGATGWATGPHLHFEIRTCSRWSCATNPLNYY